MQVPKTSLINIASLADVTISSKSRWSTVDDEREILTAEHDRNFSFHTELENSPWLIVDLKKCYCINHITILNRLDKCKENAKSLRIEYSVNKKDYYVLLDKNEEWGDVLDISIEDNKQIRYLKLSLKEKKYFHLKQILIFTDPNLIMDNCANDVAKDIIELCNLIYQKNHNKYIINISENKVNLLERNNVNRSNIRINFTFDEKELWLNIGLITKHFKDPDFNFFIETISQRFNYKIEASKSNDIIYMMKRISIKNIIDEMKIVDVLLKATMLTHFLEVINMRTMPINRNKYNINKNSMIIIDSDLITAGFADRLQGILLIIKICKEMNIDFFIKFNEPFELNKYYEFKNFNFIDPLRLKGTNYYTLKLRYPFWIPIDSLKEILLYSLRFYNTIWLGTNMPYFTNEYENFFAKNFKKTNFLESKLADYRSIINGQYITISLRFLNSLGDFNEIHLHQNKTLNENEQMLLMKKCKQEIIAFKKTIDRKYKIVILSDSSRFLKYVSDLSNVCVFPDNIMHIGKGPANQNVSINEDAFIKTLLDFNIIMEASHVYRFKTLHLYKTGFPELASVCSGTPFTHYEF